MSSPTRRLRLPPWLLIVAAALALLAGITWLGMASRNNACAPCVPPDPLPLNNLGPSAVARMDSSIFGYSAGWLVSEHGADPPEPPDPDVEPAGDLTFPFTGRTLWLRLAPGDYWSYLYVTVDEQPANLLATIRDNDDSQGNAAGYMTLLAPERAVDGQPAPLWVPVHRSESDGPHQARIELWRGWGQTPLRGVAVDLPAASALDAAGTQRAAQMPLWPGMVLLLIGGWGTSVAGYTLLARRTDRISSPPPAAGSTAVPTRVEAAAYGLAGGGFILVVTGTVLGNWLPAAAGVALLALAGVVNPVLWLAALLFGLPFAYGVKLPLLPQRAVDLIDLGVLGGVAIWAAHWVLARAMPELRATKARPVPGKHTLLLLALLVSWALVAVTESRYPDLALREWRTIFLNSLLFGALLVIALRTTPRPDAGRWLLVATWLSGAAVVALFGLWGFVAGGDFVSTAEGVRRVQAFYDSANNLALYLDRTVAVTLALAIFSRDWRWRLLWIGLAAPQVLAWLLTFSKGTLFLAAPAMLAVLAIGGVWLLRREGRSPRPLLWLAGAAALGALLLLPFVGAERFQRLFDFEQGTGFLRLQLWRSAWQMALDHPLLGVGPDQFLYAYRSNYLLPTAWQEPNLNHPHNLVLDWWTRLGLPGLVLGMAWLGTGIYGIWRWFTGRAPSALALGCLAAAAAGIAHGLIDVSYALPELMIVWVLLFHLRDA
ncbi:MAG: O-antigen ligase family protein [Caldilinea sp.]|nr:O-antigen ligase family protein [Caldilineaceae bacterium]MCW5843749.1 O-antigen ligase family protein [Caldilinea sp.]